MTNERKPGRWVVVVCLLALAAIIFSRLIWFDFVWDGRIPFERVTWRPLNFRDVPINVLLFMPLGFGLAGWLAKRAGTERRPPGAGLVLLICLILSAALEAAQLFLPDRVPSLADILTNGIGALLGYGFYRSWEMGFGRALERYATRRNLLAGLAVYALGVTLLTVYLNHSVRLSNWDDTFPLVVGNEATGKRQWSGRVERLELAAGLSSSPDFIARYDFAGEAPFADTNSTPVPPLSWRDGPASPQTAGGVNIGPGEWLVTEASYGGFSEVARRFNAFAIRAIVATADPAQRGPARLISISADAERRNVTLGQERDALIVRLRTPASGENGQKPELLVPDVFGGLQLRKIEVIYDAPHLWALTDGREHALSLAPGVAFFAGFITENRWGIEMNGDPYRYDKAYWGIVVALAVLVVGGAAIGRRLATRTPSRIGDE